MLARINQESLKRAAEKGLNDDASSQGRLKQLLRMFTHRDLEGDESVGESLYSIRNLTGEVLEFRSDEGGQFISIEPNAVASLDIMNIQQRLEQDVIQLRKGVAQPLNRGSKYKNYARKEFLGERSCVELRCPLLSRGREAVRVDLEALESKGNKYYLGPRNTFYVVCQVQHLRSQRKVLVVRAPLQIQNNL